MKSLHYVILFFVTVAQFSTVFGGALIPQSVQPVVNSNDTLSTQVQAVSIEYNEAPDASSVSTGTFFVHGSMTGQLQQTLSVSSNDVILTPGFPFFPGETVSVTATTGILSQSTAEGATTPTVWQFDTISSPSSGQFVLSNINLTPGSTFSTLGQMNGDFNGDGFIDLGFLSVQSFSANADTLFQVYLNDNGTNFNVGQTFILPNRRYANLKDADFDGDGDLDFLVNATGISAQYLLVFLNDGSGQFSDSGETFSSEVHENSQIGDIDGDGDFDIIAFGLQSNNLTIWQNDGVANFTENTSITLSVGNSAGFILAEDIENDGDLDLIVSLISTSTFNSVGFQVYENDGIGNFSAGQFISFIDPNGIYYMSSADLDNDGFIGFLASGIDEARMYFNDGTGSFTFNQSIAPSANAVTGKLGDLNGDGFADLFLSLGLTFPGSGSQPPHQVYFNDGTGNLVDSGQALGISAGSFVDLFDFDGDSDLDVFIGCFDPNISSGGGINELWLNDEPTPLAAPVLDTRTSLNVGVGYSELITSDVLRVTDADTSDSQIVFMITQTLGAGDILLNSTVLNVGETFTQDDINNNRISYLNDDSSASSDTLYFTYTDGNVTSSEEFLRIFIFPFFDFSEINQNSLFVTDEATLIHVDLATGFRSMVSDRNFRGNPAADEIKFNGIFAETENTMIMNTSLQSTGLDSAVVRVNLETGDRTLLFDEMDSIAFRPEGLIGDGSGNFYHVAWQSAFADSEESLSCFTPSTDQVQIIASSGPTLPNIGTGVDLIGGDVAIEDSNTILFTSSDNSPTIGLFRVNLTTGDRTILSTGGSRPVSRIQNVCITRTGRILMTGRENSNDYVFWEVNPISGELTVLSHSGTVGSGPSLANIHDVIEHPTTGEIYVSCANIAQGQRIIHIDLDTGDRTEISKSGLDGVIGGGVNFLGTSFNLYLAFPILGNPVFNTSTGIEGNWEIYY